MNVGEVSTKHEICEFLERSEIKAFKITNKNKINNKDMLQLNELNDDFYTYSNDYGFTKFSGLESALAYATDGNMRLLQNPDKSWTISSGRVGSNGKYISFTKESREEALKAAYYNDTDFCWSADPINLYHYKQLKKELDKDLIRSEEFKMFLDKHKCDLNSFN